MYSKSHWTTENTITQSVLNYGVCLSRKIINKSQYLSCTQSYFTIREGAKTSESFLLWTQPFVVAASLPLKDIPMNKVLQVAQRLERTKTGWSIIKNAKMG